MHLRADVMAPKCLFSSPWRPLFVLTLLIQLLGHCIGATYHAYDITSDSVCNRYRKRELSVSMSSPVIIETRRPTKEKLYTAAQSLSCTFEVEVEGSSKYGVVSVVQGMNFRTQGDSCIDYIQTIYKEEKREGLKIKLKHKKKKDKTRKVVKQIIKGIKNRDKRDSDDDDERGSRICGDVLFGLHVDKNETMPPPFANPLPPTKPANNQSLLISFFTEVQNPYQSLVSDASEVDRKGEIKTYLYISNRMLRVNEKVKLKIMYTAYQECDGRNVPSSLFHCGYGLCISRSLVNDGLVNCPFGDCIDETNCTSAKSANVTAEMVRYKPTEASSGSSGSSGIMTIVFIVLVVIVCCGAIYYCVNKRKKQKRKKEAEEVYEDGEEDKGGDDTTEFSDPSKQQNPAYPPAQPQYPQPPGPGYMPPPGGQPGYYPMVPPQQGYPYPAQQQQQAPYMGQPMAAPPPGYPGMPPPGPGYAPPAAPEGTTGPPTSGYPVQGSNYPPPNPYEAPVYPSSAAPQQSAPPGFGFGYPPQQQPMPQQQAPPYPVNSDTTAPQ